MIGVPIKKWHVLFGLEAVPLGFDVDSVAQIALDHSSNTIINGLGDEFNLVFEIAGDVDDLLIFAIFDGGDVVVKDLWGQEIVVVNALEFLFFAQNWDRALLFVQDVGDDADVLEAVSYTHLTLPTIYSV